MADGALVTFGGQRGVAHGAVGRVLVLGGEAGGADVLLPLKLIGQALQRFWLAHREVPGAQAVGRGAQGQRGDTGMIVVRERQIGAQAP